MAYVDLVSQGVIVDDSDAESDNDIPVNPRPRKRRRRNDKPPSNLFWASMKHADDTLPKNRKPFAGMVRSTFQSDELQTLPDLPWWPTWNVDHVKFPSYVQARLDEIPDDLPMQASGNEVADDQ